jgi:Fur family zinc uptake transcriptional regulator
MTATDWNASPHESNMTTNRTSTDQHSSNLAYEKHDHRHCIHQALKTADQRCKEQGARLTALRKQVLELIWTSHKPLGAYDLLDLLASSSNKRIAPATVYRTLDFLQQTGLVHRIATLNAFMGCGCHEPHSNSHFFICQHCQTTVEMLTDEIQLAINSTAKKANFAVLRAAVEVVGLCPNCQPQETQS